MTYEDFHRWTVSKELERPDAADVLAEVRHKAMTLPARSVFEDNLRREIVLRNQAMKAQNTAADVSLYNQGLAMASQVSPHLPPQKKGNGWDWFWRR